MWTVAEETSLRDEVAKCYADPLRYVELVFPWGEGVLEGRTVRPWQREYLIEWGNQIKARRFNGVDPVPPIQFSTVSGHGPGKTCLTAWIIKFLHDTRPYSRGTVTANTSTQLNSRTWAELGKWHNLSLTKHWSDYHRSVGNMSLINKQHPDEWFVRAFTARKENSEAFQGQHAEGSSSFYVFDEASGIASQIYSAAYGGLVGGESHFHEFGNGTQSSGEFYLHHHRQRSLWTTRNISSIDVLGMTDLFQRWIDSYGIHSDFVKVRVLGQFPSLGTLQFIPTDWVDRCMALDPVILPTDPLVFGVDVAREGDDMSVIYPRRGRGAHGEPEHIEALHTPDTTELASRVSARYTAERPDAIFMDGGGVGGPVCDLTRKLGVPIIEVNSANKPPDPRYANFRAYMWGQMKEAIRLGVALPKDEQLKEDLIGVQYGYRLSDNAVLLEAKKDMKKRGLASPDKADALALTYSFAVPHRQPANPDFWNNPNASMATKPANLVTDHEAW